MGHALDRVLELVVDEDELVRRLSGRRMLVDGELVQRDDDKPETVRHRLEVYREQTAPLSGFYERTGLLAGIDAIGEVDEVTGRPGRARGRRGRRGSRAGTEGGRGDGVDACVPAAVVGEVEWTHDPDQDRRTRSS